MNTTQLRTRLQDAEAMLRAGDFAGAADACNSVLAVEKHQGVALQMLGIALARAGDRAGAERAFRDCIRYHPSAPSGHSNLGNLLLEKGDAAGAEKCYRDALRLRPDHVEAHLNLGLALKAQTRLDEALVELRRATALRANYLEAVVQTGVVLLAKHDAASALAEFEKAATLGRETFELHYNKGLALIELERLDDAKESLARALLIDDKNHDALMALGKTLQRLRYYSSATSAFARAAALRPESAEAHAALASVFYQDGWTKAALDEIQKALALDSKRSDFYITFGRILMQLNRLDDAKRARERAVALDPGSVDALTALGQNYLSLGQTEDARRIFEETRDKYPDKIRGYLNVARVDKFQPGDRRLGDLERFLAQQGELTLDERAALQFALGKAYDDLGDFDRAFPHFSEANELQARRYSEPEEQNVLANRRLIEVYSREFLEQRKGHGSTSDLPIFIIGMPRSGTTLVEQILSSHPQVGAAGEVVDLDIACRILGTRLSIPTQLAEFSASLPKDQFGELGEIYRQRIAERVPGNIRVTDKLLGNFMRVGLIHLALPNARIVHCFRNPIDCCLSIFTNHFGEIQEHGNDLGRLGRHYVRYFNLMRHWRSVLPEGSFLDVQYEDTVKDVEATARRIVSYCGLEWDASCLDFQETRRPVTTLSITQVRQPVYASSVARWRNYEAQLAPLIEALGDLAIVTPK